MGMSGWIYFLGRAGAGHRHVVVQPAHVDDEARAGRARVQTARSPVVAGNGDLPTTAVRADDDQPRRIVERSSWLHRSNHCHATDSDESGNIAPIAARQAVIQLQSRTSVRRPHRIGRRVVRRRPAEIFGLLGPNGSGKTTTFRILSTLMVPSGGRATIMGHDVAREPAQVRRNIGVVFQAPSIDMKLSAEENLMMIGHIYGLRGAALKKRVAEMLAASAWPIARKKRPKHFPAACSGAWNSPRVCCTIRPCCCSTSQQRDSILARGATYGSICKFCAMKNT